MAKALELIRSKEINEQSQRDMHIDDGAEGSGQ